MCIYEIYFIEIYYSDWLIVTLHSLNPYTSPTRSYVTSFLSDDPFSCFFQSFLFNRFPVNKIKPNNIRFCL